MSSTTPTSMLRNVSGLMRVTSMKRGSICSRRIARMAGLKRSMWPDLHDGAVLAGAVHDLPCASATSLASGFSIRHAMPAAQERLGHGGMRLRRNGDRDGGKPGIEHLLERFEFSATELIGDGVGDIDAAVVHAGQAHARHLAVNVRVKPSHPPTSHHGNGNGLLHA